MPLATPLPFIITSGQGIVPYNSILISQMTLRYSTLQKTKDSIWLPVFNHKEDAQNILIHSVLAKHCLH